MSSILSSLAGRQIGWLRVNQPIVNHNQGFECAAWWQQETSACGVFPLILREQPYNKGSFFASAVIPATVTDCYFGALWGGVPVGKYDKARDMGRAATVTFTVSLPELIQGTGGHSPDKLPPVEFTVVWDHVPAVIAHYKAEAQRWFESAKLAIVESLDTDATGTKHLFSWGCFGSYAQWAGEHAKHAEEMTRYLGYMTEENDSWRKLAAKNYAWATATA